MTHPCYCDSSWGGCESTRKSTWSKIVFLNGCLVSSLCKSQSTIASSSSKAGWLAMTYMPAEAIMVCSLCWFLLKQKAVKLNSALDFIVYQIHHQQKLSHKQEALADWSMWIYDMCGFKHVYGRNWGPDVGIVLEWPSWYKLHVGSSTGMALNWHSRY